MARRFKLTNKERSDCARAVIIGAGRFTINDKLDEVEVIIGQLLDGADKVADMNYNFETCDPEQKFVLTEKQLNRLVNDLKNHNWPTAFVAIEAKKLVAKLEDAEKCQDTEKQRLTEA